MLAREIIQRVREIQVRTGRHVADVLAGEYVSVFKGRGMEFDEVRPYIPGDDVRTIDWNVTARTGEPFVKRFVEERQLTLNLIADVSGSQDFGSQKKTKREAAAELCALLAFSAIRNDDKVGLTLFHGEIEQFIPPRKGQKHALRVVREVLAHGLDTPEREQGKRREGLGRWLKFFRFHTPGPKGPPTDIGRALKFLLSVNRRRSVCFLVSDFLDQSYERALRAAHRKHDVIAVLITDPHELELPKAGLIQMTDAETGRPRWVDTSSRSVRREFGEKSRARIEALEKNLRNYGVDLIHVDAGGSVVEPLIKFFRQRERRARR